MSVPKLQGKPFGGGTRGLFGKSSKNVKGGKPIKNPMPGKKGK